VEAQQAEHPCGRLGELVVGPGEHAAHIRGGFAQVEGIEPVPSLGEVGGVRGQRPVGRGGPGTGDRQRERKPGAQADQLGYRFRLGCRPARA
jgi:hypothetical protein